MWGRLTSCDWVTPGGDYNQQFEVFTKLINIPWHWDNFDCRLYYCNITDKKKYNLLEMHSIFRLFELDITLFQS